MSLEDRKLWAETHRDLPGTAYSEGATAPLRGSRRGELFTSALAGSKMHALADEGSYFVATNPTIGTGVAGIAAADGFDDLETLAFLRNTESSSTGKRLYLDYILLRPTAAGTNGTNFSFAMKIDKGNNRFASGGSAITPVSPNMDSVAASVATLRFGAVVTTAASADARIVASGLLRSVIKVVGDTYLFDFGASTRNLGAHIVAGTAIANIIVPCPPVVVGPNQMFLLHEFAASQSAAASYTFEMGWYER
jgi:hypothetical protein